MRTFLPEYDLRAVRSLDDALRVLAEEPGVWRPFAGGTDLMVLMEAGTLPHARYLNLWGLKELKGITISDDAVSIGALTTYSEVLANERLAAEFPLLSAAARETGGIATQNRGTIGGNIANASPAADTPPALLVYDAAVELVSARGTRRVEYHRFHQGYKVMDLAPDELIARVLLPRGRAGWVQGYRKVGTRRAQAISKVCFAGAMDVQGGAIRDIAVALGSVAPVVTRCYATEDALRGARLGPQAAQAARDTLPRDISPIDDVRSTARYRLRVAQNLVAAFVSGEEHG
jgi:CO/xanthine dehydrogenase FAD-binding subunit